MRIKRVGDSHLYEMAWVSMMTNDTENELDVLRRRVAQYEAWFRAIDENSKFDFWFKNAESEYTYVNPHFAKNMGRDVCNLQNVNPEDIFEGDRLTRVKTLDRQVMDDRYLKRVIPCDASGVLQMHEEHRFAVTDTSGEPIGLGCFAFEVTEKSLAEETLHQAEKIASLCSWRWAADTNLLVSCSDQMAALLGISITEAFEIFPKRAEVLVLPEDRDVFKAVEARRKGDLNNGYEIEYRLRRPDGHILHIRETAEPFSTSESAVEYLGVMQDITRQKFAETALKKSNETLERKVQLRTAELQMAKDKAESANKAKSQFLATMSHELRTPMNGVLGMTQIMQETPLNADQMGILETIYSSGFSLVNILNDILDFSKFEAGSIQLDPKPFNLKEAVNDVVSIFKSSAEEKNLDLIINIHPTVPDVIIGDAGRLRQVLMNLVGNSIKFTLRGHVTLDIKADVRGEVAKLSIKVIDTGIGIAQDKHDIIFDEFTQAEQSTTRSYGGIGLGLSISRNIINAMPDGKISVQSELGQGSTFIVDVTCGVVTSRISDPDVLEDIRFNKEIVLVVTADDKRAQVLKKTLQGWNLKPVIVNQAKLALNSLKQAKLKDINIEAVITDDDLGQYRGRQLIRAMKKIDLRSVLPTILLTSEDNHKDIGIIEGMSVVEREQIGLKPETLKRAVYECFHAVEASNLDIQHLAA